MAPLGPGGTPSLDPHGTTQPLVVPMVAGTPRYLLMRNVYNEDLRAPKVLQNCTILFQVSGHSSLCHCSRLLTKASNITALSIACPSLSC